MNWAPKFWSTFGTLDSENSSNYATKNLENNEGNSCWSCIQVCNPALQNLHSISPSLLQPSTYRPYRMKHDPFPILIHLGEREDYSGVSRGREIVLCCCVPSSRRASYILIHRTSAQRISPKRWTMDDWKSELHIHLRGPRNWGGNLALSHPFY